MEHRPPKGFRTRKQEYTEINGCSRPPSCYQVVSIILFLLISALNSYLITQMLELSLVVLYLLYAFNYVALLFTLIDYFKLTFSDPSDPRLKNPSFAEPNQKTYNCHRCQALVSETSHHCNACRRCVSKFDHHCVFLNNCIGGQNYSLFGRFLMIVIVHMSLGIAIGLIFFLKIDNANRWIALAYTILNFIVLIQVAVLAIFHCYLSFCLYQTTLQFLRGQKEISKGQNKVANDNSSPNKVSSNTPPTTPVAIHCSPLQDKIMESPVKNNEDESTGMDFKRNTKF